MRYSTVFDSDGPEKGTVVLDLGSVRESARVRVNGKEAGFALMSPYRVRFPVRLLKRGVNTLEVEVTGTAANRIRWNDRIGIDWKRFYDVNVVSYGYTGPLDATNWPLEDCGLLGPVSYRIDPN